MSSERYCWCGHAESDHSGMGCERPGCICIAFEEED